MNVTDVSLILAILPLHSEEPLNFPRIDTVLAGPFFIACGGRTAYYIGPCWYQAWAYGAHVKVERRGVMCNACKMSEIGGKINPC